MTGECERRAEDGLWLTNGAERCKQALEILLWGSNCKNRVGLAQIHFPLSYFLSSLHCHTCSLLFPAIFMLLNIPDCLAFIFVLFFCLFLFFYRQTFRIQRWFIVFWNEVLHCSDSCTSFSCCLHQLLHWYFYCFLPPSLYFLFWWQSVTVWWQLATGPSLSSRPPGNQSSEPRSITKDHIVELLQTWLAAID